MVALRLVGGGLVASQASSGILVLEEHSNCCSSSVSSCISSVAAHVKVYYPRWIGSFALTSCLFCIVLTLD